MVVFVVVELKEGHKIKEEGIYFLSVTLSAKRSDFNGRYR